MKPVFDPILGKMRQADEFDSQEIEEKIEEIEEVVENLPKPLTAGENIVISGSVISLAKAITGSEDISINAGSRIYITGGDNINISGSRMYAFIGSDISINAGSQLSLNASSGVYTNAQYTTINASMLVQICGSLVKLIDKTYKNQLNLDSTGIYLNGNCIELSGSTLNLFGSYLSLLGSAVYISGNKISLSGSIIYLNGSEIINESNLNINLFRSIAIEYFNSLSLYGSNISIKNNFWGHNITLGDNGIVLSGSTTIKVYNGDTTINESGIMINSTGADGVTISAGLHAYGQINKSGINFFTTGASGIIINGDYGGVTIIGSKIKFSGSVEGIDTTLSGITSQNGLITISGSQGIAIKASGNSAYRSFCRLGCGLNSDEYWG